MAITVRTSTVTSGANTTGFTLVINSAVVAGDILLLGVTNRDSTADPTVVDNDSGTWLKVHNQNANTNGAITVWWRRATSATASKTITVSGCTGSASGVVTPYVGALAVGTPYGTPAGEANASANETQVGITTTRPGSFACLFVGCTSNDTLNVSTYVATDPATLAERGEGVSSGGSDCSMAHASAVRSAAGATGNISWSQTNGTGASAAFELIIAETVAAVSVTQDSDYHSIAFTAAIAASNSFTQSSDVALVDVTVEDAGSSADVTFIQTSDSGLIVSVAAAASTTSYTQELDVTSTSVQSVITSAISYSQTNDISEAASISSVVTETDFTQISDAHISTSAAAIATSSIFSQDNDVATINSIVEEPSLQATVTYTQSDDANLTTVLAAVAIANSYTQSLDIIETSVQAPSISATIYTQANDAAVATSIAAIAATSNYSQISDTFSIASSVPAIGATTYIQNNDVVTSSTVASIEALLLFTQVSDITSVTVTGAVEVVETFSQTTDSVSFDAAVSIAIAGSYSQASDSVTVDLVVPVLASNEYVQTSDIILTNSISGNETTAYSSYTQSSDSSTAIITTSILMDVTHQQSPDTIELFGTSEISGAITSQQSLDSAVIINTAQVLAFITHAQLSDVVIATAFGEGSEVTSYIEYLQNSDTYNISTNIPAAVLLSYSQSSDACVASIPGIVISHIKPITLIRTLSPAIRTETPSTLVTTASNPSTLIPINIASSLKPR